MAEESAVDLGGRKEWLIDTYQTWLEQEGLPIMQDYCIPDLLAVPLKPWKRKGGLGAFIRLVGAENADDAYLCEIPPGASLKPQKHLFDELIYIISGKGATTLWNEGSPKQTFEWQEGSLFSPPLNTWHQHFNAQGDRPVRYVGVTLAPVFLNLFNDVDYIFNNNYVFKNRYNGEKDYFKKGQFLMAAVLETNFVPNVSTLRLDDYANSQRGAGATSIEFQMSNNIMEPHISEFPMGTYKKAHRHSPGAHIIMLSGQGYSLMWIEDRPKIRIDWKVGSMFAPPGYWFHQHFNTGKEPARYLALKAGEARKFRGILKHHQVSKSVKLGGDQIEYQDEAPDIRRLYKEELAKTGAQWRMSEIFPGE